MLADRAARASAASGRAFGRADLAECANRRRTGAGHAGPAGSRNAAPLPRAQTAAPLNHAAPPPHAQRAAAPPRLAGGPAAGDGGQRRATANPAGHPRYGGTSRHRPAIAPPPAPAVPDAGRGTAKTARTSRIPAPASAAERCGGARYPPPRTLDGLTPNRPRNARAKADPLANPLITATRATGWSVCSSNRRARNNRNSA